MNITAPSFGVWDYDSNGWADGMYPSMRAAQEAVETMAACGEGVERVEAVQACPTHIDHPVGGCQPDSDDA